MTESEFLERMDLRLARMEDHMTLGNELMGQIREEFRLNRREHALNRREHALNREEHAKNRREHSLNREEHRLNRAQHENGKSVMREMVLELRDGREILKDIRHGIQSNTEGLLRVLDELRRGDDPGAAGA